MRNNNPMNLLGAGLLLAAALAGCGQPAGETTTEAPAQVEEIPGSDVKAVTFTEDAAAAIGVEIASVASDAAGQLSIPYAAVIYYVDGSTWTYTVPNERKYVRVPIVVASISGDVVTLTEGPAAGTPVVVVGAPEVLGAELEIDGEQ